MITLTLSLPNYLNASLQVGDMIYAKSSPSQVGSIAIDTNSNHIVGVLRQINDLSDGLWALDIDDTIINAPYVPVGGDFIMFSKYDQSVGDVVGYYAKAKFVNYSREKAEIFSVGSEITINSK